MRRTIAASLLAILACSGAPASADVFGYVDAAGTVHLATEKLDERYALFLKSQPGGPSSPASATNQAGAKDRTIDPALTKTRLFQRLVDHPNIAKYEPLIRAAAMRRGLDPELVKAVVAVESGFDPAAVSDKGAVGLMQVLPGTGERYGVRADRRQTIDAKLADPQLNLDVGTRYLSDLVGMFPHRQDLALAAYNAGENAVVRYRNAIPPFPETQAYVKLVDQFQAFYTPRARAATAAGSERIRVVLPGRRNLPDPNVPLRLPAPDEAAPRIDSTAATRPRDDADASPAVR